MIKVLLVEDNKEISQNIRLYLEDEFEVQPVFSGEEAILYLNASTFDLVILDLMLPGIDGMSVLSQIKKKAMNVGVLMLTAKEDLDDKLRAFDLGAQDYLTKPFFMEELKARMKIILRSMGKLTSDNVLRFKELEMNLSKRMVMIRDEKVDLNERLYHLLEYFLLNQGYLLV